MRLSVVLSQMFRRKIFQICVFQIWIQTLKMRKEGRKRQADDDASVTVPGSGEASTVGDSGEAPAPRRSSRIRTQPDGLVYQNLGGVNHAAMTVATHPEVASVVDLDPDWVPRSKTGSQLFRIRVLHGGCRIRVGFPGGE